MNPEEKKRKEKGLAEKKGERTYKFPLPMKEASKALMEYITEEYGNKGECTKVSIVIGQVVVEIEPKVKS